MSKKNSRYMTVIKENEEGQKTLTCIDLDEVNFIDSHNRKIRFHIDNQIYYQITTMSEMDELLGEEGFVSLDRQNLVNLLKVKSFDSEAGKVYFEENPKPESRFAIVAKMKYQLVSLILKRYVSHNNDTTMEVTPSKETSGVKGFLGAFKS